MEDQLEKIIQETEAILSKTPAEHNKKLDNFTPYDEALLVEFLAHERNDKEYLDKYQSWEIITGTQKKYTHPRAYKQEEKEDFKDTEKQLKKYLNPKVASIFGVEEEKFEALKKMPAVFNKMLDLETKIWESCVAYAKQIASENGISALEVMQNQDARDMIFRKMFENKQDFKEYNNPLNQAMFMCSEEAYNLIDELAPRIDALKKIPIIGKAIQKKINQVLSKLPPKETALEFIKDDTEYNIKRAEQIYNH